MFDSQNICPANKRYISYMLYLHTCDIKSPHCLITWSFRLHDKLETQYLHTDQ